MNPPGRRSERILEDEMPGSVFAGCLWGVLITVSLVAFLVAFWGCLWLIDKGEAQMQPSFDTTGDSAGE